MGLRAGKVSVLVLDFDGVIVESNGLKTEAFERVFRGYPAVFEEMMAYHRDNVSMGRVGKFEHMARLLGRADDAELSKRLSAEFAAHLRDRMLAVPLVPGAEDFLRAVTPRLPVYLASVTPAEELESLLERRQLRHWFTGVYGCPPWTKDGAIRDILQREHAAPDCVLLIGDSAGDQRAAAATGIDFLARNSGLPFDEPAPPTCPDLRPMARLLHDRLP